MGRPNMVHNIVEKKSENKQNYGMIRRVDSQVSMSCLAQDFKCAQCKLEDMLEIMLKKK
jgi:hypothetical protein